MKIQKLFSIFLIIYSLIALSCASQTILNDKNPTPAPVTEATPEKEVDDFAERLASVQTGNFEYIYAFKRKDGDVFNSEDKKFLKENAPPETNQWVLTSDKKAVIAGSNYPFTPENLDALKKRFKIEDYSPKKDEPKKEQNVNVNR